MLRHALSVRHLPLILLALLMAGTLTAAQTYNVSTEAQLQTAVSNANGAGGDATILIADGTYTLSQTLQLNAPGITVASASGDRSKVILQGDAMSDSAAIKEIFSIASSNCTVRDLTLRRVGWHLIQIHGESNADAPTLRNLVLQDAYEQLVKVSADVANLSIRSDLGVVADCFFSYTAGVGPQWYIGGIDAHAGVGWVVRGNTFQNIISPDTAVAEFAIHFWDASADNLIERNRIIDCDRGIGFGLDGRGNSGGVIRNNMIARSAAKTGAFADVGIALIESPGTQVYNNTVFLADAFPWTIEYRFATTTGVVIRNNLVNTQILARDGASGTVSSNISSAVASWFANPTAGDLHLSASATAAIDGGAAITGLGDDFDGQSRPLGGGIDVGADEVAPAGGNSAPVASDQTVSTAYDTAVAITLAASDADGDALSYTIISLPTHGTLGGSGASRTYTPTAGYSGADSFSFSVDDGTANSNTALVSIAVGAAPGGGSSGGPSGSSSGGGCGAGGLAGLVLALGCLAAPLRRRHPVQAGRSSTR